MKILHLITTIEIGGAEKHLLQLATIQRNLGHEVKIIYLKGEPQLKSLFERNHVEVLNRESINSLGIFLLVLRSLSTFNPTIVHAHLPKAELLVGLARVFKAFTFVVSRHNSEPLFSERLKILNRILTKFISKQSNGVIYISEAAKRAFEVRKEIAKGECLKVIHYGIDLKVRAPRPVKYSKNKTKKCFTLSRLTEQKNLERLIEAFSEIRTHEYHFHIYGEGHLKESLENKIRKNGLQEKIKIQAKVENVEQIFEKYDFFILGSLYEGFGLALLEAMNSGKFIIASGRSSIVEILGKEYKFLFDPLSVDSIRDTIMKAWRSSNDETLDYLHERVRSFAIESMVSKTLNFYALVATN